MEKRAKALESLRAALQGPLYLGHPGGYEHYGLFVVHNQLPKWVRTLSLFVVRCLICLFVACVTCLWLGCVMCLFLVCVLFLFLVCVMCLCTLASLRSAGARFARCGRFAAAAAASRPQAITPNIIVFIVRGLTFVNVSALDFHGPRGARQHAQT